MCKFLTSVLLKEIKPTEKNPPIGWLLRGNAAGFGHLGFESLVGYPGMSKAWLVRVGDSRSAWTRQLKSEDCGTKSRDGADAASRIHSARGHRAGPHGAYHCEQVISV